MAHFKALMRKNWINWKRTPCGSISEFVCPIFLMSMLQLLRSAFDIEVIDAELLLGRGVVNAPVTNLKYLDIEDNQLTNMNNSYSENYVMYDAIGNGEEFGDFYYFQTLMGLTYTHCFAEEGDLQGKVNSTLIGYVHNDNVAGELMEKEIETFLEYQKDLEYETERWFHLPLELKRFDTKEDMIDYSVKKDYYLDTAPAMCFGFVLNEMDDNKGYQAEIMYNDQLQDRRS